MPEENRDKNIKIDKLLKEENSRIIRWIPGLFKNIYIRFIKWVFNVDKLNTMLETYHDKRGFELIDELFEDYNLSFIMSAKDKVKIPTEGRLVIVANTSIGALDGLALLKAIHDVRRDVKLVVNDVLLNIENLKNLFLPYDVFSHKSYRNNHDDIINALEKDEAVIFFPEVQRIPIFPFFKRTKWLNFPFKIAKETKSSILPIYIQSKSSLIFQSVSVLHKKLSAFLLPNEIYRKKEKEITLRIGNQIPFDVLLSEKTGSFTERLKEHVYRIGQNKKGLFRTLVNTIAPVDRIKITRELFNSELIGTTRDDKKIFLCHYKSAINVMTEIARLRELTFRKVGEGTGQKLDSDIYDKYYCHLVLWDDHNLEIVGSYRFGLTGDIIKSKGVKGIYTSTLYDFSDEFITYLDDALELGRSFVQQKYWNSYALDYLWHGIGAFIARNRSIKYMFGAVSISSSCSTEVKDMLVYFFMKWFGVEGLGKAHNSYIITEPEKMKELFSSDDYKSELQLLDKKVKEHNATIPVLFKQYTKLTEEGGVKIVDFSVDPIFNSVNCLLVVEMAKIKKDKLRRYLPKENIK